MLLSNKMGAERKPQIECDSKKVGRASGFEDSSVVEAAELLEDCS